MGFKFYAHIVPLWLRFEYNDAPPTPIGVLEKVAGGKTMKYRLESACQLHVKLVYFRCDASATAVK